MRNRSAVVVHRNTGIVEEPRQPLAMTQQRLQHSPRASVLNRGIAFRLQGLPERRETEVTLDTSVGRPAGIGHRKRCAFTYRRLTRPSHWSFQSSRSGRACAADEIPPVWAQQNDESARPPPSGPASCRRNSDRPTPLRSPPSSVAAGGAARCIDMQGPHRRGRDAGHVSAKSRTRQLVRGVHHRRLLEMRKGAPTAAQTAPPSARFPVRAPCAANHAASKGRLATKARTPAAQTLIPYAVPGSSGVLPGRVRTLAGIASGSG